MSLVRIDQHEGRIEVVDEVGRVDANCERFLERLRIRGLSAFTVESYAYDLALIHRWMASSQLTLPRLSADDVHRFLAWERVRQSHPKSINRRLHTLPVLPLR